MIRNVTLDLTVDTTLSGQDLHDAIRFRLGLGNLTTDDVDPSAAGVTDSRLRSDAPTLALLTGTHEGDTLLVHVWPDGTGEVATRRDDRWGIPSPLTPAP